jgi:hypothetical protein
LIDFFGFVSFNNVNDGYLILLVFVDLAEQLGAAQCSSSKAKRTAI